ncbi:hypothetical protein PP175_22275 [Aneurinibacillus sp. Ricciae_BoGa-3]|uniref:hypothetical protein n=1 Tax=Aneurinibacillus sp. Ricciae_BoGa-3 TaxID=3022697 RepID=UPI002341B10C|nr:hypothetical protein [Aneurinibacillus sp. Ricciae_BoGa-3]WCK54015.1 hypothetical protein PP175_22275 [Aneurinibacillus sp. Ricciae_BoGa-3]
MEHILQTKRFHDSETKAINEHLSSGWVLLETSRSSEEGSFILLGKPTIVVISELKSIIRDYEDAGLKLHLAKHMADKFGDDHTDVDLTGRSSALKTEKYFSRYREIVD